MAKFAQSKLDWTLTALFLAFVLMNGGTGLFRKKGS